MISDRILLFDDAGDSGEKMLPFGSATALFLALRVRVSKTVAVAKPCFVDTQFLTSTLQAESEIVHQRAIAVAS
jgi:hypothetical protein